MEVVKMEFGSHLYGTSTPNSDKDYKGIRLSSWEEIALGRIPKQYLSASTGDQHSKNTKDDIDEEIFSLHTFIKEALEGQTFALDMLHAPASKCIVTSEIWKDLQANRSKFYTKNIESFLGYALGQAAKYGVKGSRLNDAKAVLDWLAQQDQDKKVIDCNPWTIPSGEHIIFHKHEFVEGEDRVFGTNALDMVEVCNRKFHMSVKVSYAYDIVKKFYDQYGERAKLAAENKNVDWKAIHHAFRAGYQIRSIFKDGGFEYPLKEKDFLIDVKLGKIPYLEAAPVLEDLMDEIKALRESSTLPEKPDVVFWNGWLTNIVEKYVVPAHRISSDKVKRDFEILKAAKADPLIQAVCKAARECV